MRILSIITVFISLMFLFGVSNNADEKAHDATEKKIKKQTNCPVMKANKIDKKLYVDADGKRIYVCCPGCIGKVKKNPKKYLKKLKDAGITLDKTPQHSEKKKGEDKKKEGSH